MKNLVKICVPTWYIFAGPVTQKIFHPKLLLHTVVGIAQNVHSNSEIAYFVTAL